MFTTIFRIGPLVMLQFVLACAAIAICLFLTLPSCTYYTLSYLTLVTFLIEMIASLRLMKSDAPIRRDYLYIRVTQSKTRYLVRTIWDNINILLVIMLLYYSLIYDGFTLYQSTSTLQTPQNNSQCQYTLFALCLFAELQKTLDQSDSMVMWLLYVASGFLTTFVCISFSKQYYQYCTSINANRKLVRELGTINQTLLDCQIYLIKGESVVNSSVREQVGICSICMHELLEEGRKNQEKVIRLRCDHFFHKECIDQWLVVKDHCPYRCYL